MWIKNLLSDRWHQTKVGCSLSELAKLISEVIQGSAIGPLLFLIFINDLASFLQRCRITLELFADDAANIYANIVDVCDVFELQKALDALTDWAQTWQLAISINKCCVLNVGKTKVESMLYIDGCLLPIITECRDLGVTMTSDLSMSNRISAIVAKAHQRANIILCCFVSRDRKLVVRAFEVHVRLILEYDSGNIPCVEEGYCEHWKKYSSATLNDCQA